MPEQRGRSSIRPGTASTWRATPLAAACRGSLPRCASRHCGRAMTGLCCSTVSAAVPSAPGGDGRMARQWPIEKEGSTGEAVRTVQYLLRAHGQSLSVDGIFGPRTEAAVRAFQQAHGLAVDGVVGNATWMALLITVRSGSQGDAVRAVQSQLVHHGSNLQIDGVFGPMTNQAVRAFQQRHGLAVDGIVGTDTWFALVTTD